MKEKQSAISIIWLIIILLSVASAAWFGNMDKLTTAVFEEAKSAVFLAIGLIGSMAFWLGMMKILETGGALNAIARLVSPVMSKLFPDVPKNHPAVGAMIMNISANMLGMANAATPFGINAMGELDKLNKEKGRATNAMCLFLAINTSSVTLLPLGVITIRASAGAATPASILIPSLLATITSTAVAIIMAKLLQRSSYNAVITDYSPSAEQVCEKELQKKAPPRKKIIAWSFVFLVTAIALYRILSAKDIDFSFTSVTNTISTWLIPVIIAIILLYGYVHNVKIYETLVKGAKDGFETAIRIIPFMVAIFVAIGMLKASGAMDIMIRLLDPLTSLIGMPAEALPMALMRPLSGSGAFGIMSSIVEKDPNSFLSYLVSVMQGSTETTFYVLALYFGSVQIKNSRHALPAALCADFAGIMASVFFCRIFW